MHAHWRPETSNISMFGDGVEVRLHFHTNNLAKGIHRGHQQHAAFAGPHVDERELGEVDAREVLHDRVEFVRRSRLVESLGKDLAQAHTPR
jgi:hypothetical protein